MIDALAAEAAEIAALEKQVKATPPPEADEAKTEPEQQPETPEPDEREPEGEGDEPANRNPAKFVRRRDLIEQEERRKVAERELATLRATYAQDMAKLNERLAVIAQNATRQPERQEQQPQIPDRDADPIGYFEARQAQLEKRLADAEKWRADRERSSHDDDTRAKIGAEVSRLEAEFAKTTPDYSQAQEYLQKQWVSQGQLLGVPPQQAVRFFAEQVVRAAAAQGKNPGEVAYEYAKTLGYQKANGAGPAKQGPSIDTLQRGVAAAKSTSLAPGKSTPGLPTLEALRDMDEDEFASKFGARDSAEWNRTMRKLMGAA